MHPILFRIGDFTVRSWGVMVLIGVILGLELAYYFAKKEGYTRDQIYDIGFYLLISSIIGARVFYVLYNWHEFKNDFWEIFKFWHGGAVFYGSLVFGIPTFFIYMKLKKLPVRKFLSWSAAPVSLATAIGRIGCFLNGCCFGKPCSGPFCVIFKPGSEAFRVFDSTPIHPTELYESFGYFLTTIIVFWIVKKKKEPFEGFAFFLMLVLMATVRLIVDNWRYYESYKYFGPFDVNQWISIGVIIFAIIGGLWTWKYSRRSF